jgi:hypothetical protein
MDRLVPSYHNLVTQAGLQVRDTVDFADADAPQNDLGGTAYKRPKALSRVHSVSLELGIG